MTLTQFFDYCNGICGVRPSSQRWGQWAFNLLHEGYPDIANDIRGGEADPFHDDSRMPIFLQAVLDHVPTKRQHLAALTFLRSAPADASQKVSVPHSTLQQVTYFNDECPCCILAAYIVGETLHFLSSGLKTYEISLSEFSSAGEAQPDFNKLSLGDYGSEVIFGEWEAAADWVIMQVDEEMRAYWADKNGQI